MAAGGIGAAGADRQAWQRASRPKPCKLASNLRLRDIVEDRVQHSWSPQQIAGWLKVSYPNSPEMHVSHESIYRTLFVQSRGALRKELTRYLRTGRVIRRPKGVRLPDGRGGRPNTLHISERPPEADDRAVPGHWEGDLVFGKHMSPVATLVERSTRFLVHRASRPTPSASSNRLSMPLVRRSIIARPMLPPSVGWTASVGPPRVD